MKWRILLVLLVAASSAAQQGTTGEISGVVSAFGASLPDATITLRSEAIQGTRFTVSGDNGGYRFALLPPGDYAIHVVHPDFSGVEFQVRLALAQSARLDAAMDLLALAEEVVATPDSLPSLDANLATGFEGDDVELMPAGRSLREIVLLSPLVTPYGLRNRLTIAGAPSWDSLFLVDGVVVNENLSGQPHDLYIEDAIEEVTLLAGSISAEYGRFTGGVVSAISHSGGNSFHGSLRENLSNGRWTEDSPWPDDIEPYDELDTSTEATLGGFVLRDRLWFFGAGRSAGFSQQRFTTATNVSFLQDTEDRRWQGKLTGNITPQHSIVVAATSSEMSETNVITTNSGRVLDLDALAPLREQNASLYSATWNGLFGSSTAFSASASQRTFEVLGNGGMSADRIEGTNIGNRALRAYMHAPVMCGICGPDERDGESFTLKALQFLDTRAGSHSITAGAESYAESRTVNQKRSASEFYVMTGSSRFVGSQVYPVFGPGTVIFWSPLVSVSNGDDLRTSGLFVNDAWDISSRFRLNLGLRYDRNDATDADGNMVSDDDAFSPRLGMSWDPRGDGRRRLFAGYGRYVSKILGEETVAGSAQQDGRFAEVGWRYRGPIINGGGTVDELLSADDALRLLFAWFDAAGGIANQTDLVFISYPGYTVEFPAPLTSPSAEEWTLGYAIAARNAELRIDAISREWDDFYALQIDTTTPRRPDGFGNLLDVAWIVNDQETFRTYRAVQLQGSWNAERFSAGGAWVVSKLRGNDEAEEPLQVNTPRTYPLGLWYPEFLGYEARRPVGYLNQDQRHRAKLWATAEVPAGKASIALSLLHSYQSGRPYSAVGEIDVTGRTFPYEGLPQNPGYRFTQTTATGIYYFSGRGAYRLDDVHSTDFAVHFALPLRQTELFFHGDVLNLFAQSSVVSVNTEVITRMSPGGAHLQAFNPFTEAPVEGIHYDLGPQFGQPIGPESYQMPRTVRFSVGARF